MNQGHGRYPSPPDLRLDVPLPQGNEVSIFVIHVVNMISMIH